MSLGGGGGGGGDQRFGGGYPRAPPPYETLGVCVCLFVHLLECVHMYVCVCV